jgi:uroporphyrinogen decarboxylase
VDPSEANRLVGGRVALRGNLDPSVVLLQGTPEGVREKAREAIDRGSGARFILSSGCDIAPTTPAANLDALVLAARKC